MSLIDYEYRSLTNTLLYMYYNITVARREAASESWSSLFVFFAVAIVLIEQFINKIIADLAKQFTLRMRSTLFY